MDKNALCKVEINKIKINQLIAEIVQLQFRIEDLEQEKYIDIQRIHAENARLRSEVLQMTRHFMKKLLEGTVGLLAPNNTLNKPHQEKSAIDKRTQTAEANVGQEFLKSPRNGAKR